MAVILQVSAGMATSRDEELNDIYRKTQKYVNRFNTMANPEKQHQEVVDELDNLQEYVGGGPLLRLHSLSLYIYILTSHH